MSKEFSIFQTSSKSVKLVAILKKKIIDEKLNNGLGFFLIFLLAAIISLLSVIKPILAVSLILLPIGVLILLICILNREAAIYINTFFAFFIYFIDRIVSLGSLPIGTISDILILTTFLGLFVQKIAWREFLNQFIKSQIGIWVLILFLYLLFQLFNPYANSFTGWYQAFRKILGAILFFFICFTVFINYSTIKRYLTFLFFITVVVAIYGCMQQWLGFFSFDREAALFSLENLNLQNFDGSYFRKFSTFPDSSSFGICMAACSVLYIIIGLNHKNPVFRRIIFFGVFFMILALSYSSNRTSNGMLVAGLFFYSLITFNKKSTRIFTFIMIFILAFIIYSPFYSNNTINRFRSTFKASQDDSYLLRVRNRAFIQPYIYSHPIGGGIGTTAGTGLKNNPGHPLAGFMPDSGYLSKALETGSIGLLIICILYFVILKESIIGYFKVKRRRLMIVYAASAASLFSFYVGEYAQMALGQITDVVVYYPLIAIVMQAYKFESKFISSIDQKAPNS